MFSTLTKGTVFSARGWAFTVSYTHLDVYKRQNLPSARAESVVDWLRAMQTELAIPSSLAALGVSEDRIDDVITLSLTDPCAAANPTPMTPDFVRSILRACLLYTSQPRNSHDRPDFRPICR